MALARTLFGRHIPKSCAPGMAAAHCAKWHSAFADDQTMTAAMLDWLLHHAHSVQITGESYRLKD